MTPLISGKTFIESEFSNLEFNDKRLSDRIKKVALAINESPAKNIILPGCNSILDKSPECFYVIFI